MVYPFINIYHHLSYTQGCTWPHHFPFHWDQQADPALDVSLLIVHSQGLYFPLCLSVLIIGLQIFFLPPVASRWDLYIYLMLICWYVWIKHESMRIGNIYWMNNSLLYYGKSSSFTSWRGDWTFCSVDGAVIPTHNTYEHIHKEWESWGLIGQLAVNL